MSSREVDVGLGILIEVLSIRHFYLKLRMVIRQIIILLDRIRMFLMVERLNTFRANYVTSTHCIRNLPSLTNHSVRFIDEFRFLILGAAIIGRNSIL